MKPNTFNAFRRALSGGDSDFMVYRDPVDTGNSVKGSGRQANAVEENDVNKKIDNKQTGSVRRSVQDLDLFEASLLLNFSDEAHLEVQRLAEEQVKGALLFQERQDQFKAQMNLDSSKRQSKLAGLLNECNGNQRKLNLAYRQYWAAEEEKLAVLNREVQYHQGVSGDLDYQKKLWEYYVLKLEEMHDQQGHQERVFEAWQNELFCWWCNNVVTINTKDYGFGSPMKVDDEVFRVIDYPMLLD